MSSQTQHPLSQREIEQHLVTLMPEWDLQAISNLAYLSGGYSNINYALDYQGKRYVLRVPQIVQPFVNRQHELDWYNQLPETIGIKPVALDTATGTMLTPWIAGELLADIYPRFSSEVLAKYLRKLHSNMPNARRLYDLEAINAAYWQDEVPPTRVTNPTSAQRVNCHNDLNPWNVIVTPLGWVTLDWEFVGDNDPLFDLVSLHQGLALNENQLRQFAVLYLGAEPEDLGMRLDAVQIAYWSRELGWAHFQVSQGNRRKEIHAQIRTAEQALERLALAG